VGGRERQSRERGRGWEAERDRAERDRERETEREREGDRERERERVIPSLSILLNKLGLVFINIFDLEQQIDNGNQVPLQDLLFHRNGTQRNLLLLR
jgi:hypothetical protein